MAVTGQERAHIGLPQLQHLHWDVTILSLVKQRNWVLNNFVIYMSVFQVLFAIWKVTQAWAPWAMFSRKAYDRVKHYSGTTYCVLWRWQLPRHLFFPLSDISKKNSCAAYSPLCQESSCWCILPSLLAALQRVLLLGLLKKSHCREMVLTLASHCWVVRSRAEHRNSGDSWFCIFSNTWTQLHI